MTTSHSANSAFPGPIGVSSNGRYFVDGNGKPFFWLGDTQWQLFRDFSTADAEAILKNRADKGFSVVHVMFTGVGDGTKPNLAGQTPWVNDDPAMPNEAYFKQVDTVVRIGLQNQLILVLGVFHQLQVSRITLANAGTYARWIAKRYRGMPNIIWSMYPKAEQGFVPVIREIAAGLQEGDDGVHMITVHPDPSPASSSFIHDESWLACNMIQTWNRYESIHRMVTADYNRIPSKPVVMAEGAYEDESHSEYGFPITPLLVRKQAYWSYMAGGHHSYGHSHNWQVPPTWRSSLDAPGAFQMGFLKRIFTSRQWWQMVPDQSVLVTNPGKNLNTAVRSRDGDWAMVYLSSPTAVSVDMSKISTESVVNAFWIDPRDGSWTRIGKLSNTGIQAFSTPDGWEDALLLLEARTG